MCIRTCRFERGLLFYNQYPKQDKQSTEVVDCYDSINISDRVRSDEHKSNTVT